MAELRLAEMLKKNGVSKREFARRLKVDSAMVFRYFREGYNPTLSTLDKFAEALQCKIAELIEDRPRGKKK